MADGAKRRGARGKRSQPQQDAGTQELLKRLKKLPAQFARDFPQQIEEALLGAEDGTVRRTSLAVLAQPAKRLLNDVKSDGKYADSLSRIVSGIPAAQDRLRDLIDYMETASTWVALALTQKRKC